MPNYSYKCNTCNTIYNVDQGINEKTLTTCFSEGCSGKISRIITGGAGFLLKGTGYYVTDFKNKGTAPIQKPETKTPLTPTPSSTPKTVSEKA